MIKIFFKQGDTNEVEEVLVASGGTLMEAAVSNGISGIEGECGGACACGTCHVHVEEAWRPAVGEASSYERDMLACLDAYQENSRLACQIAVVDELDGVVVTVPAS